MELKRHYLKQHWLTDGVLVQLERMVQMLSDICEKLMFFGNFGVELQMIGHLREIMR